MGIKGLRKLLEDIAPQSIQNRTITQYTGCKIAIDTSMLMYQFLTAMNSTGGPSDLKNDRGENTAHISGICYRAIKMMENEIIPVFVFDGPPPEMKVHELKKRKERLCAAQEKYNEACEHDDKEQEMKYKRQCVRVTKQHVEQVKMLLTYMGVASVDAIGEAEATCAMLAKKNHVAGVATEDADALTFGTPLLIRNLNASDAKKNPIFEISLQKILSETQLTFEQFVDLCILCGCDYTPTLTGIGPKTAYKLIAKHKNIENILCAVKESQIPENFDFMGARKLFLHPDATQELQSAPTWNKTQLEAFLLENQFSEDRVLKILERLEKCHNKTKQSKLDSFFKKVPDSVLPPA